MKAVFCGSLNPITVGHLNVIRRAAKLADTLYVVILVNREKTYKISLNDRLSLVRQACSGLSNVIVDSFDGALIDYCEKINCDTVIKAFRNEKDYLYEVEMAKLNKQFGGIETVFLYAEEKYVNVSSEIVREKVAKGEDITQLVPQSCARRIVELLSE